MPNRTVFFISDGTGITAETFGNAILAQFETTVRRVRLPFLDSVDKAHQAVRQINHTAEVEGRRPLVFATVVNMEVLAVVKEHCHGMMLDMFGTFVEPLEEELGIKSNHRVGRFSDASKSKEYNDRIEAINFALMHDDGQSHKDLEGSDVILVGVSRSGKTPTSLYLAMQHGLRAALGDPQRTAPQFALRQSGKLPRRGQRGRGHDAPRGHPLALDHDQVDRGDRHHHPAGNPAGAAGLLRTSPQPGQLCLIRPPFLPAGGRPWA
jgi:hypothetical protein